MPTDEEKRKKQTEATRRYRQRVGFYSESQKQAIKKYQNKIRDIAKQVMHRELCNVETQTEDT